MNALAKLNQAEKLLAETKNLSDLKQIHDIARAAEAYAQAHGLGITLENHAMEIRLLAARRIGELVPKEKPGPKPEKICQTPAELSISHQRLSDFRKLAEIPMPEFKGKIEEAKAKQEKLSYYKILQGKQEKVYRAAPELPQGKYFVLYADPPWQYQNTGFEESASQKYQTMPTDEICALPVHETVDSRAVLFLWATNPFLKEGIQVCEAWGFKYKTNFVWVKNAGPSIGWFNMSRHELLLIATKGEGVHPQEKHISWFQEDVRRHSQKPDSVYAMIESMYPGPYLELFARQRYSDTWEAWGNEV